MAAPSPEGRGEQIAARLAAVLLRSGLTVSDVANLSGCTYHELYRFVRKHGAYSPRQRRRRVTAEQEIAIRRLLMRGKPHRQIADRLNVCKTAVTYRSLQMRRAAELEGCEEVTYRNRLHVCPHHGLTTVWPCVRCDAEAARNKRPRSNARAG